ncbi:unnamed protein product, partial [Citrullus colocynthis]
IAVNFDFLFLQPYETHNLLIRYIQDVNRTDMDEILTSKVSDGFKILDGDALVILRTMSKGSAIGGLVS